MRVFSYCTAFFLILLVAPAQSAGFITGQLVDEVGGWAVAGADVWIFDATTAELVTETKTDISGHFASDSLSAGAYKIRVKLIVFQDSKCKVFFEEFLGVEIAPGKFEHADVFDTALAFVVTDGDTTQIARPVENGRCPDPIACIPVVAGIEAYVFDGDLGIALDGILFRARDAVNAMPVFEGVSGYKSVPGWIYWKETICGRFPDVKLNFADPAGEFASEYYLDQPNEFSLGMFLDLIPWTKLDKKIILERVSLPDQILNIGDLVEDLLLPENTSSSLTHALEQAYGQLSDENPNNDKAACGLLKGFANRLNGSLASGEITQSEYDLLLESVTSVTEGLDCKN